MKIKCQKMDLLNSINISLKAVSSKSTMSILECMVISVRENAIVLTANDMELGIQTKVKGEILEKGEIAINAKIFSEIVRKLPDSEVNIQTDQSLKAVITCEKSVFQIAGRHADEFPALPDIVKNSPVVVSSFSLKEIIRQTIFSISDNESNKIMTGELFEVNQDELKMVSLDGHRVSIRKLKLLNEYDPFSMIIHGKALHEISKILSGDTEESVLIYHTDKHVLFEFHETIVLSRLIEGEYYRISHMFTNEYDTKVEINKKEFLNCIERASLLLRETDKKPIIIGTKDEVMDLKMHTSIGSMHEEIDIKKEGKEILIGFNPKFLIDVLRVIEEEEVSLYFTNAKAPCFIRDKSGSYMYLILPVNFNAA